MTTTTDNRNRIDLALAATSSDTQQTIAEVGLDLIATLLRKNADYGDSALTAPVLAPETDVLDALLTRSSDKVRRIAQLRTNPAQVCGESFADSVKDLAGYLVLILVYLHDLERDVRRSFDKVEDSIPDATAGSEAYDGLVRAFRRWVDDSLAESFTMGELERELRKLVRLARHEERERPGSPLMVTLEIITHVVSGQAELDAATAPAADLAFDADRERRSR